jgi:hypothetical protein
VFFEQLLTNTQEGFFADPVYGGNREDTTVELRGAFELRGRLRCARPTRCSSVETIRERTALRSATSEANTRRDLPIYPASLGIVRKLDPLPPLGSTHHRVYVPAATPRARKPLAPVLAPLFSLFPKAVSSLAPDHHHKLGARSQACSDRPTVTPPTAKK